MSTRNIHVNTASYTLLVAGKKKNTGEEWDVLEFSSLTELKKYRKSHPEKMAFSYSYALIRDNEGRVFTRQGEVMNPLQYVPFNQTLYFINGDDPAQVAWMKRQTPPTLESKIILVQGSIPEMQKSLDSRVYFDQNGVLCQRLGIDQVPARVSAVPGDRFLKVEFIPAEEGRK